MPEATMETILRHVTVHDAPQTLDWVQMQRIGWQKVQFKAAVWAFQPQLQHPGVMVSGVVKEHMDSARLLR